MSSGRLGPAGTKHLQEVVFGRDDWIRVSNWCLESV